MKILVNSGKIGGCVSPTLRAVYYKAGVSDIIVRTDGLTRQEIIVVYEVSNE